ncbi:MAG: M14 family metallopeptidase [Candidatus Rifleibacteriota bacterium]
MKRYFIVACCIFTLCTNALLASPVNSLVRIKDLSQQQIQKFVNDGFDMAKTGNDFAEVVVTDSQLNKLKNKNYSIEILIENLDDYIKSVQAGQTKNARYYTFDTATDQLKKWAEEYKEICVLKSIGKSCENRDIWALKVSDNPQKDEAEPAALIMGLHHAREWPSVEVPMATIKKLLEDYNDKQELKHLVDSREIWFVPIVNPDGLVYSQEKSKYWRKNRRDNGDGNYGVDLNRNYGYKWGNTGASSWTSSNTYHGTGPFSEPEACAIRDFATKEKFQASISFHTYSELILYPYGYGYNIPNPNKEIFVKMSNKMAEFNRYRPQNSADLYPAMGDSDDFLYGELKVLSFTFELCSTFVPSATQINDFCNLNVPAVLYLIDKAGTYGLVSPSGSDEIISALDFKTAHDAIKDINNLYKSSPNIKVRNEVLNKIEKISLRLAELTVEDLKNGSSEKWNKINELSQASLVKSFVRTRVLFNNSHGEFYRQDIIEQIKK